MIKRFSSIIHRDKPEQATNGHANGVNGTNGINGSNGTANGTTDGITNGADAKTTKAQRRSSTFGFSRKHTNGAAAEKESDSSSTEQQATSEDVANTFSQFASLIHASKRPLPTQNGDGTYNEHKVPSSFWNDIKHLNVKDGRTLIDLFKQKASGEMLIDDKTMIMERVIQLVAGLPPNSKSREELTNQFIGELWDTLEHPPMSYLGDQFLYRHPEGKYNNPIFPMLGAANTPYARTCRPGIVPPGALPDPGVIFDAVMGRKKYKKHPNNVSSILWYWASIIIHDLFRTDHKDFHNSQTSSYLDLSPLYGSSQEEQDAVRTHKDGMLKPDTFSEKRLLGFPPGVGVILIMFNRFHNYIAEHLALINEHGRFTKPGEGLTHEQEEKSWQKYDNDLFQTARLITCGLYINITLVDYVRQIINLNRSNTTWTLDPRAEMGKAVGTKEGVERGTGNQVSAEFNLFYRWHSCISERDDKWTQNLYRELFGKEYNEVNLQDLMMGLGKWEHSIPADPALREFGGFKRQTDGTFADDDLVECIASGIEDCAGAFGANNVPLALRPVEMLGIIQSRKWNLAGLNEFRKHFGLKAHETFEDINSDPEVADQLRHLYDHPDFVELYPGIVAEEAKEPMVPGVGICPTYTISRVILSDAVGLVRGDRFYTTDYHPRNLTNWGYNEVQYDLSINQGCVFYKLFLRAFPNHFAGDSIYAHYPMTIPSESKKIMTNLGRVSHFNYDKPARIAPRVNIVTYQGAKHVLVNADNYKVMWNKGFKWLMGKGGMEFMLAGDGPFYAKQRETMGKLIYREKWHAQVKNFYEYITQRLLFEKTYKLAGVNQVDIIRDVGNITHVHFAANVFSLPLKTKEHPKGIYTEHELYMVLAIIFVSIFFDIDPAKSFPIQMAAKAVTVQLGKIVEANVKLVNATGMIAGIVDKFHQEKSPLNDYGVHMIRRLLDTGMSVYDIAWSQMVPTAGAMVANQAEVFAQALDFYLGPGKEHLPDINRWAKQDTAEADDKLLHYAMEGIRLAGTFGSYRKATKDDVIDDQGRQVNVKAGDHVFVSFVGAAKDTVMFPDPDVVKLDRPLDNYIHYGVGPHKCLGREASQVALVSMFRVVGRLDNLRRALGDQGELKKVPRPGGFFVYMREDRGGYFPFPTTMKINFDGELKPAPEPVL